MKDVFAALLGEDEDGGGGNAAVTERHAQFLPLLRASPGLVQALQRVRLGAGRSSIGAPVHGLHRCMHCRSVSLWLRAANIIVIIFMPLAGEVSVAACFAEPCTGCHDCGRVLERHDVWWQGKEMVIAGCRCPQWRS
jgi:hypothetical protein